MPARHPRCDPMDLYIATHGASEAPVDACVGQSDVALSSSGFTAVQTLAASWDGPPPRFLFTSDLRRCQQSAQIFAAHFAIEPLLEPRLRELDFGTWQGRRWETIMREDGAAYEAWLQNPVIQAAPGGESFNELLHRSGAWLASLLATASEGDTVLAMTHGNILRALLCHALGLAPRRYRGVAANPAHASRIRCHNGVFQVSCVNASRFQDK